MCDCCCCSSNLPSISHSLSTLESPMMSAKQFLPRTQVPVRQACTKNNQSELYLYSTPEPNCMEQEARTDVLDTRTTSNQLALQLIKHAASRSGKAQQRRSSTKQLFRGSSSTHSSAVFVSSLLVGRPAGSTSPLPQWQPAQRRLLWQLPPTED